MALNTRVLNDVLTQLTTGLNALTEQTRATAANVERTNQSVNALTQSFQAHLNQFNTFVTADQQRWEANTQWQRQQDIRLQRLEANYNQIQQQQEATAAEVTLLIRRRGSPRLPAEENPSRGSPRPLINQPGINEVVEISNPTEIEQPNIEEPPEAIINQQTQQVDIAAIAAWLFQQQNPGDYNILQQQPNFDPQYFTISLGGMLQGGTPIYARNPGMAEKQWMRWLSDRKALWTSFLWNQLTPLQQKNQNRYPERQLLLPPRPYHTTDPVKLLYIGDALQLTNVTTVPASQRAVYQGVADIIRELSARAIPITETNQPNFGPNTVTQPELIAAFPALNIGDMRTTAMFTGIVHDYSFALPSFANYSQEEQINIFRDAILKGVSYVISQTADRPLQAWFLLLTYLGPNNRSLTITAARASKPYILERIQATISPHPNEESINPDFTPLELILTNELHDIGSDVTDPELQNYTLDLTTFTIRVMDPTRTGGVLSSRAQQFFQACIAGTTKSKSHASCRLSWGTIRDYKSHHKGCFFKILREVIVEQMKGSNNGNVVTYRRLQTPSYLALWRKYNEENGSIIPLNTELSLDQARQAAQWAGYNLLIYNVEGGQLYTDPCPQCDNLPILRVLHLDNHYFLITNYYPELAPPSAEETTNSVTSDDNVQQGNRRERIREEGIPPLLLYYDLETVYSCGAGEEHVEMPYACAYTLTDISDIILASDIIIEARPSFNLFDGLGSLIITIGKNYLRGHVSVSQPTRDTVIPSITIKVIAYNGAGFDHWLLFRYLLGQGFPCITAPVGGKAMCVRFQLYNKRRALNNQPKGRIYIDMWDPFQYLHCSLSRAAEAFRLNIVKGDADHLAIQTAYCQGQLSTYLANHPITNYVSRDVELLRGVTIQLRAACIEAINEDPLNYPTMASMGWGVLSTMNEDTDLLDAINISAVVSAAQAKLLNDYLRTALIGGRVQGIKGDHNASKLGGLYLVDVVSEYPFVMRNQSYPRGQPLLVYSTNEAIQYCQNREYIGLYYVRYDQRPIINNTGFAYLPLRLTTLCWDTNTIIGKINSEGLPCGLLPDITIERLINSGCSVQITTNESLPVAIVWRRTEVGETFGAYIDRFASIKRNEDAKPLGERNMAMRELGKLGMNAVSGKASQRTHYTKNVVYTERQAEQFRAMITPIIISANEDSNVRLPEPIVVAQNFVMMSEPKKRPKYYPVQLSIFIYAYARDYMWEHIFSRAKLLGGNVWYSDTDSAIINAKQLEDLRSRGLIADRNKEFGKFEVEMEISRLLVAGPKFYCAVDMGGKEKLKVKGVRNNDKFEQSDSSGVQLVVGNNGVRLLQQKLTHNEVKVSTYAIYRDKTRVMYRDVVKII